MPMERRRSKPRLRGRWLVAVTLLALATKNWAFVPSAQLSTRVQQGDPPSAQLGRHSTAKEAKSGLANNLPIASGLLPLLSSASADAATPEYGDIPGALVAYLHYFSIVLAAVCLTAERLTVKPGMTEEEEKQLAVADVAYGVAGLLVVVTGYLRVTQYGKGWEFYQHEPIFWLKLLFVAISGACSFFVTATIVKRNVARSEAGDAPIAPVTPKLAARITSIVNAELLALGSIPLTATLMARGVGYVEWLPWQAGAAPAVFALFGLGFKYIKEAIDWQEEDELNV